MRHEDKMDIIMLGMLLGWPVVLLLIGLAGEIILRGCS